MAVTILTDAGVARVVRHFGTGRNRKRTTDSGITFIPRLEHGELDVIARLRPAEELGILGP